jgi:hypothetical protein
MLVAELRLISAIRRVVRPGCVLSRKAFPCCDDTTAVSFWAVGALASLIRRLSLVEGGLVLAFGARSTTIFARPCDLHLGGFCSWRHCCFKRKNSTGMLLTRSDSMWSGALKASRAAADFFMPFRVSASAGILPLCLFESASGL